MTVNVLPGIPAAGLTHAIWTDGVELTVRAMVVVADRVPDEVPVEVPWIVIVEVPVVAALLAISVSRLLPVVGLVANAAVTPLGIPDAVRVTAPVNPPTSVTWIVSVPPAFRPIVNVEAEGVSVKLPVVAVVIVIGMVMDLLVVPEVTETVIVDVPSVAVALAVRVMTNVVLVGLVTEAETPEGRPVMDMVGVPVAPVTVMVHVTEPPCCRVNPLPQDDEMLKPAVTVSAMVVLEVSEPEVPVMVTVKVPMAAVALAVNVSTLALDVGLVAKAAVTPEGRPVAASVTEPVNGLISFTLMVTVQLEP
jgi:hypothetical protein